MPWHTLTLDVPDPLKDAIVASLDDSLAGVWETGPAGPEATRLVLYLASDAPPLDCAGRIRAVFERSGRPAPAIVEGAEDDADWLAEWRKSFRSFTIGGRFRVVPDWEEPPAGEDRLLIRIEPGMAFGTGTHETTALVIEALEATPMPELPALDVGTGSGILAIALSRLGAGRILACDLDGEAIAVAAGNLRRNDVAASLFGGSADSVAAGAVGLIAANLTFDAIRELLPEFGRVLVAGGRALLSGILEPQVPPLAALVGRAGFRIERKAVRGEWAMMVIRKHGD